MEQGRKTLFLVTATRASSFLIDYGSISNAEPEILPKVAVITVLPLTPSVVANPFVPGWLLMVATEVSDELQVTDVVMSCVELSEKFPVAVYCTVVLYPTVMISGVTVIERREAAVTVSEAEPEMFPAVAIMPAVPAATPVAEPFEPTVLLMVAMALSDELHSTEVVMSCMVLSLKIPMAVNCCFIP